MVDGAEAPRTMSHFFSQKKITLKILYSKIFIVLLHYLQNKIQKKESQDNLKISLDASTVKV